MSAQSISTTYRSTPYKLAIAQRVLGTASGSESIAKAFDMEIFRQELIDGTAAMLGVELDSDLNRR